MERKITILDKDVKELISILNLIARGVDPEKYGLPPNNSSLEIAVYEWVDNKSKKEDIPSEQHVQSSGSEKKDDLLNWPTEKELNWKIGCNFYHHIKAHDNFKLGTMVLYHLCKTCDHLVARASENGTIGTTIWHTRKPSFEEKEAIPVHFNSEDHFCNRYKRKNGSYKIIEDELK